MPDGRAARRPSWPCRRRRRRRALLQGVVRRWLRCILLLYLISMTILCETASNRRQRRVNRNNLHVTQCQRDCPFAGRVLSLFLGLRPRHGIVSRGEFTGNISVCLLLYKYKRHTRAHGSRRCFIDLRASEPGSNESSAQWSRSPRPRSSEPRFVKVKRADYHFSVTVGTKKRGRGVEVSLCAPARSTQNKQMHLLSELSDSL